MGALSGNRLRPNADCSCYRSSLVDPLSARLPDRTPPRRGKRVEPSRTPRLAQSRAIRLFVTVRPAGSDEGASPPPSPPNPRPSPRPLRPTTVRPRPPARRRFVRQPSAQRVCVAPNRRPQPCSAAKRLADRAPIEPPPISQPARSHVGSGSWVRPPVRPCRTGAEGGRGEREPRLAGTRQAPCSDDRTPVEGTPTLPYLQGPSGGRPAIVAPGSPAARLDPRSSSALPDAADQEKLIRDGARR